MKTFKRQLHKKRHISRRRSRTNSPLRVKPGQKAVWVWYWGVDADWGKTFSSVRTERNPHWCIRRTGRSHGHIGYDYERRRVVCRPYNDGPKRRLKFGWRYEVYG